MAIPARALTFAAVISLDRLPGVRVAFDVFLLKPFAAGGIGPVGARHSAPSQFSSEASLAASAFLVRR